MNKFKTTSTPDIHASKIGQLDTSGGRGGGRGRGRGGYRGRGRGRCGRGSRGRSYDPHSMLRQCTANGNFTPQARIYESDDWNSLQPHQRLQVQNLKIEQGQINGRAPPHGFVLENGVAQPSARLVAAAQQSLSGQTTSGAPNMMQLPPPPQTDLPPVPPVIDTNSTQAGATFVSLSVELRAFLF